MAKWTVKFTDTDRPEVEIEADRVYWADGTVELRKDDQGVAVFNALHVLGVQVDEPEPSPSATIAST